MHFVNVVRSIIMFSVVVCHFSVPDAYAFNDLTLTDGTAPPGSQVNLQVLLDNFETGLQGWAFGVCHEGAFLDVDSVTSGAATQALNDGDGPEFEEIVTDPFGGGPGWYTGVIIPLPLAAEMDPGTGLELNVASYDVLPGFTSTQACFCSTLTDGQQNPVTIEFLGIGNPALHCGTVTTPTIINAWVAPTSDYLFDGNVATFSVGYYLEEDSASPELTWSTLSYAVKHDANVEAVGITGNSDVPNSVNPTFCPSEWSACGSDPSCMISCMVDYWGGVTEPLDAAEPFDCDGNFFPPLDSPTLMVEFEVEWTPTAGWQNGDPITAEIWAMPRSTQYWCYEDFPSCTTPFLPNLVGLGGCPGDTYEWVSSPTLFVTVNPNPCDPPVVESTSGGGFYCAGTSVVLEVIATGTNLSYQWRKNGTDIPSANKDTLPLAGDVSDSGSYTCAVTGDCGSATSESILVTFTHCFLRGDADGDGIFNGLADGLYALEHQFLGGPVPPCLEAADADSDGTFNGLADGLFTLEHQFLGGPPPGAPFPVCGLDPNLPGSVGCDEGTCP